jgi:hypothetical protein
MNASWDSANKYWVLSHAENPDLKYRYTASWNEGLSVLFKGIIAIKRNSSYNHSILVPVSKEEGYYKEISCTYHTEE